MPTEALSCPGFIDPLCQIVGGVGGSAVSSVAGSAASDVLGALSAWVVNGATWLLGQVGHLLADTTSIDLRAGWFKDHYRVMVGLTGVVLLPLLLLSVVQAVYRQSTSALVRVVLVQLPLAALLSAVAVQLVQLGLTVTDNLSSSVAASAGGDVQQLLSGVAGQLANQSASGDGAVPAFVLLLGALLVALGGFALWLELLVRASAVYVAVLFLPLALASLVWPPISHWCRRLVDTLIALVLSKFVVVAVLSLATGALAAGTGSGFSSVLEAGALLLLATFVPFTILRLVPAFEAGAVHQLEDARRRSTAAATTVPRHAAAYALRAARLASFDPGSVGSGAGAGSELAGDTAEGGATHDVLAAGGTASPPSTARGTIGAASGPGGRIPVGAGRATHAAGAATGRAGSGEDMGGVEGIGEWQSSTEATEAFAAIARGQGPLSAAELRGAGLSAGRSPASALRPTDPEHHEWITGTTVAPPPAEPGPPAPTGGSTDRGTHVIGRDELGPKIVWVPPASEGPHVPPPPVVVHRNRPGQKPGG